MIQESVSSRELRRSSAATLTLLGLVCALLLCVAQVVCAEEPDTRGVSEVFALGEGRLAAADPSQRTMRLFTVERSGAGLQEQAPIPIDGTLMAVVPLPDNRVAYATGSLDSTSHVPARVFAGPLRGSGTQSLLFEHSGERNQVAGLRWSNSKLWLLFFDSKYFTKVGYLSPAAQATAPWRFTELSRLRMGDSFDHFGDTLVVGRSYGDQQGEDGDLLLYQQGQMQLLPSYRGVRGIKVFGDSNNPSIVVGDGWHSHYGQVAQGRVSLLRRDTSRARYSLEILDRDRNNYSFDSFFTFTLRGVQRIAAVGNASLIVYSETAHGEWRKDVVYTATTPNTVLHAALVRVDQSDVLFAVVDGGIKLIRYDVEK